MLWGAVWSRAPRRDEDGAVGSPQPPHTPTRDGLRHALPATYPHPTVIPHGADRPSPTFSTELRGLPTPQLPAEGKVCEKSPEGPKDISSPLPGNTSSRWGWAVSRAWCVPQPNMSGDVGEGSGLGGEPEEQRCLSVIPTNKILFHYPHYNWFTAFFVYLSIRAAVKWLGKAIA